MEKQNPAYLPQIKAKLQFLQESIEDVEAQIKKRKRHHNISLKEIDQKTCDIQSAIYALELFDPQNAASKSSPFQKEISLLEKEKRISEVELLRDVNTLTRELRQLKKEHRAIKAGGFL